MWVQVSWPVKLFKKKEHSVFREVSTLLFVFSGEEGDDDAKASSESVYDPKSATPVEISCPPNLSSLKEEEVTIVYSVSEYNKLVWNLLIITLKPDCGLN